MKVLLRVVPWFVILHTASACRGNQVGTAECTPSSRVFVACGCDGVGSCAMEPDPVLRVCDGELAPSECTWENQLGENNDGPSCGTCPGVSVICPASGSLLVVPRGFFPDEIVRCDWALRPE